MSLEELDDPYASDRVLLRSIFTDLDANKNNLLEKREFRRAVQRRPDLGSFLRPRDFLKSFKAMDTSSDGAISVNEFVSFCINAKYKYLDEMASPKMIVVALAIHYHQWSKIVKFIILIIY